jgi:predicted metal-dependent hydrolase
MVDGILEVSIPAWMSKKEEADTVDEMRTRLLGKQQRNELELPDRAATLASRYTLPQPKSVAWSTNMAHRWGSCTPVDGSIRISSRLARVPTWVLDAVIVHELAHLVHADHSPAFWELVERYPRLARAQGFLEGLSFAEGRVATDD